MGDMNQKEDPNVPGIDGPGVSPADGEDGMAQALRDYALFQESPDQRTARRSEDEELVKASRAGDGRAYGKLVERYQRRVYALAFGILRQREDAWDVAQEAFVKAYRNLDRFAGQAAFYTWLYRITYNLSLDVLRSRGRRDTVNLEDNGAAVEQAIRDEARPEDATPNELLQRRETAQMVQTAMEKLSEKHRAIIVLREIEGLSYEEMADVLGISKGTVMSRLFHARKNLQALLRPYLEEDGAGSPVLGFLAQGA
jgi:RNA polymerase sigma-70 factor (ECF subfamily)